MDPPWAPGHSAKVFITEHPDSSEHWNQHITKKMEYKPFSGRARMLSNVMILNCKMNKIIINYGWIKFDYLKKAARISLDRDKLLSPVLFSYLTTFSASTFIYNQ